MMRKYVAEGLGTALLLVGVVGSGIMGQTLADGNTAIALLANAVATGCMLYVIITTLGPISGAHFNPAVTLAFWLRGEITARPAVGYVLVQVAGGIVGVWATHAMFDQPILQASTTMHRTGIAQWWSEAMATFGLLFVIFGGLKSRPEAVPALVAFYITGAYWFTASTSFANPAVTIARGFSDTFAGIYPGHIAAFIVVQLITVPLAHLILTRLFRD
ncbi:aquaporin [Pseudosulfitobacter pseudonitzschiae]|uniref:aquaporin n=1 Tax=Pseudosulfitobacter pseudonitzschiae TaxID=1402135 RepID=UPI001AF80CB5|nr:MIP/aquaporin family protein [Pseudosulfitobacter pseudonitzschiae]MBM1817072.1 aquaporin family protein [Pseudosulfitobacter pseudonitzschiae]MBM1834075.1 aquaporin family protein [Pseudosulfitobacter pseudonitzschiae]MBM1838941.1 aquaporin family protein [Pseudosulfitobacter pseudonitzschiae]MBM1843790.1 aquaporin family protein [Pseudosulfitobacter pseudonitzschiae]MBM1848637.1 aquaporin family protein [Pseudosulfitobacter pseudonitzschiae]